MITLITSWDAPCGVAEYGETLAEYLLSDGHNLQILANHASNTYPSIGLYPEKHTHKDISWSVKRVFPTGHDVSQELSEFTIEGEYVILNYQDYLFPKLEKVLEKTGHSKCKKLGLIIHDTCINPQIFSWLNKYGINFTVFAPHQGMLSMLPTNSVLFPLPYYQLPISDKVELRNALSYPNTKPVAVSFGLGRCITKDVMKMLNDLDWNYFIHFSKVEDANRVIEEMDRGQYQNVWIEHGFCSRNRLFNFLKCADIAILNYPDVGGALVTSAALRMAISAELDTYVSNSSWFSDVNDSGIVHTFNTIEDLKNQISYRDPSSVNHKAIEAVDSWNWHPATKKFLEVLCQ